MFLDRENFFGLRLAKPMAGGGTFSWHADEPAGLLDFSMPEPGYFCYGRWRASANVAAFDQELNLGFTTAPDGVQLPVLNMNPALRGVWISDDDAGDVRPVIVVAQVNEVSKLPGWYSTFGFFWQDKDGLIYAPESTTEVVGQGMWIHPY